MIQSECSGFSSFIEITGENIGKKEQTLGRGWDACHWRHCLEYSCTRLYFPKLNKGIIVSIHIENFYNFGILLFHWGNTDTVDSPRNLLWWFLLLPFYFMEREMDIEYKEWIQINHWLQGELSQGNIVLKNLYFVVVAAVVVEIGLSPRSFLNLILFRN